MVNDCNYHKIVVFVKKKNIVVRAEHPAEVSPDKQNNVEGEKPAEVANPPPEKVSQQQAAPPASQAEGKLFYSINVA